MHSRPSGFDIGSGTSRVDSSRRRSRPGRFVKLDESKQGELRASPHHGLPEPSLQMLYDICMPKLYAECFIGNLSSFLLGLQSGSSLINEVMRLHLYSGTYSEEPTYSDLLSGVPWWNLMTPSPEFYHSNGATESSLVEEARICTSVAIQLEIMSRNLPHVLPKLKIVSLGDVSNTSWTSPIAQKLEVELLNSMYRSYYKSLSRLLIELPSVAHACQSTQFGPLCLPPGANHLYNPPAIFTYHPKLPSTICICTEEMGPIILRTLNRHYFTCMWAVEDTPPNAWTVIQDSRRIGKIVDLVTSSPIVNGNVLNSQFSSIITEDFDLGNTRLELYDYVRILEPLPGSKPKFRVPKGYSERGCRPAASLDPYQKMLDEALPLRWRGRVVFKDREEAPPCTACGLDLAEQWDHHIRTEGVGSGNMLGCEQVHL